MENRATSESAYFGERLCTLKSLICSRTFHSNFEPHDKYLSYHQCTLTDQDISIDLYR